MRKPKFSAEIINGVMCIVDEFTSEDPTPTVTNNVEGVLTELGSLPEVVIYRDTNGLWDGIEHEDGAFLGFYPLMTDDREEAIKRATER